MTDGEMTEVTMMTSGMSITEEWNLTEDMNVKEERNTTEGMISTFGSLSGGSYSLGEYQKVGRVHLSPNKTILLNR